MPAEIVPLQYPEILKDVSVLVVDNDRDSRALYSFVLESYGAKVAALGSVQAALDALDRFIPTVLICEMRFPNESIAPLIQQVRALALDHGRVTPVLGISTCTVMNCARELEVESYLLKPIDIDYLVVEVWKLIHLQQIRCSPHIEAWLINQNGGNSLVNRMDIQAPVSVWKPARSSLSYRRITMLDIDEMGQKEIHSFLAQIGYGHLGFIHNGKPCVMPMHYHLKDSDIYLFTTEGMKTHDIDANPAICLQVEEIRDPLHWRSVIVNGRAERLTQQSDIDQAMQFIKARHPSLSPAINRTWIDADGRSEVVTIYRIHESEISGRTTDGASSR